MFDSRFRASMVYKYRPIQREAAHALLRKLHESPEEAIAHFRQSVVIFWLGRPLLNVLSQSNAGSTIMKLVYGIEISERDDVYIDVAEQAVDGMAKAAVPGAFLVEILPIREFLSFSRGKGSTHHCA